MTIILKHTVQNDGNTWKVEKYLILLKLLDPSFYFHMARRGDNGAVTAVVWQMGTMQGDFELYGCVFHVDLMKIKLNLFE